MNMQLIQKVGKKFTKKVPVIKPGCTVRVHQKIKEGNKERIQVFEGLVISINSGSGPDKSFTVRKMVGGIGVEKIFPLYSTNITKIQVTKSSNVRRAKLYYMRGRAGKSARLREKHLTEKDVQMEEHHEEEEVEAETPETTETEVPKTEATAPEEKAEVKASEGETPTQEVKEKAPEADAPKAETNEPKVEEKVEEEKADAPAEVPAEKEPETAEVAEKPEEPKEKPEKEDK